MLNWVEYEKKFYDLGAWPSTNKTVIILQTTLDEIIVKFGQNHHLKRYNVGLQSESLIYSNMSVESSNTTGNHNQCKCTNDNFQYKYPLSEAIIHIFTYWQLLM